MILALRQDVNSTVKTSHSMSTEYTHSHTHNYAYHTYLEWNAECPSFVADHLLALSLVSISYEGKWGTEDLSWAFVIYTKNKWYFWRHLIFKKYSFSSGKISFLSQKYHFSKENCIVFCKKTHLSRVNLIFKLNNLDFHRNIIIFSVKSD